MGRLSRKEQLKRLSAARDQLVKPVYAVGYVSEHGICHLNVVDSLGRATGKIIPDREKLYAFIDSGDITVIVDGVVLSVSSQDQEGIIRSADNDVLRVLADGTDRTKIQNMLNSAHNAE